MDTGWIAWVGVFTWPSLGWINLSYFNLSLSIFILSSSIDFPTSSRNWGLVKIRLPNSLNSTLGTGRRDEEQSTRGKLDSVCEHSSAAGRGARSETNGMSMTSGAPAGTALEVAVMKELCLRHTRTPQGLEAPSQSLGSAYLRMGLMERPTVIWCRSLLPGPSTPGNPTCLIASESSFILPQILSTHQGDTQIN